MIIPRIAVAAALLAAAALPATALPAAAATSPRRSYIVLAERGVSWATALRAIKAAGGRVTAGNHAVGMFTATSSDRSFALRVTQQKAILGAANARPVATVPALPVTRQRAILGAAKAATVPALREVRPGAIAGRNAGPVPSGSDPLDGKLWNLRMIRADRARRIQPGKRGVTVGILDTGIDARNPDLAARFDAKLSRNFARDIPELDGPCEVRGCLDPIGTDDGGHGTHVAGIVGAAADGFGISGVAPNVTLVSLKGGQDAGLFFLDSVVNALTYAGDVGIDVVTMSFFVDPWLYNCRANPQDSAAAQIEQRTAIEALTRAVDYARARGVTLVGATGNEHTDLGKPKLDDVSPNYPYGGSYTRTIDNATCLQLPVELPGVIGVSAVGPTGQKADYSNYGTERTDLAAPGGWLADGYGTARYQSPENQILSARPVELLQQEGLVDEHGNVSDAGAAIGVAKRCKAGRCGYYGYQEGTSMAVPHVAGVAALVVSQFGSADPVHGGLTLAPSKVEKVLLRTASRRACPNPRLRSYAREGLPPDYDAYCAGGPDFNGFYGHGIVNAEAAVRAPRP